MYNIISLLPLTMIKCMPLCVYRNKDYMASKPIQCNLIYITNCYPFINYNCSSSSHSNKTIWKQQGKLTRINQYKCRDFINTITKQNLLPKYVNSFLTARWRLAVFNIT